MEAVVRSEPLRADRKKETSRVKPEGLEGASCANGQTEEHFRQGCSKSKGPEAERCRAGWGSRVGGSGAS